MVLIRLEYALWPLIPVIFLETRKMVADTIPLQYVLGKKKQSTLLVGMYNFNVHTYSASHRFRIRVGGDFIF